MPGNLAGALALRDAGDSATRVDVGYLTPGRFATSGGTKASAAGVILEPGFIWRSGHLVTERQAARVRSFRGRSAEKRRCRSRSEHLALPRLHPGLGDVRAYVGTFEAATRPMQALSALGPTLMRRPRPRRATQPLRQGLDRRARRERAHEGPLPTSSPRPVTPPASGSPRSALPASTSTTSPQAFWPGAPNAPPPARCRARARSARLRMSASTSYEQEPPAQTPIDRSQGTRSIYVMEKRQLISHGEAKRMLRRAGYPQERVEDVLRHLPDPIDPERDLRSNLQTRSVSRHPHGSDGGSP